MSVDISHCCSCFRLYVTKATHKWLLICYTMHFTVHVFMCNYSLSHSFAQTQSTMNVGFFDGTMCLNEHCFSRELAIIYLEKGYFLLNANIHPCHRAAWQKTNTQINAHTCDYSQNPTLWIGFWCSSLLRQTIRSNTIYVGRISLWPIC